MKYPFETPFDEIIGDIDSHVDSIFSCLESEFMVMPRGNGFVDYNIFERGYESLKVATKGFRELNPENVLPVAVAEPISIVVLRAMLGFSPPEWGYIATQRTGINVTQGYIRSLDRNIRLSPQTPLDTKGVLGERLAAMIETACDMLCKGESQVGDDQIHRLSKADTRRGLQGIRHAANMGIPYAMLLYERFLGRPFASHRDSVSELVGDALESAIENVLAQNGVSYRKTKRAEKVEGFDQAPDFIIPSEFNPKVVIEAKITEDDGTARDKVTRIQHLGELSMSDGHARNPRYQVVACVGGRGFGVRREDMKKVIITTKGKVFTLKTIDKMVENTELKRYRSAI